MDLNNKNTWIRKKDRKKKKKKYKQTKRWLLDGVVEPSGADKTRVAKGRDDVPWWLSLSLSPLPGQT